MQTANELAILTLVGAASFATALLLNWLTLSALFHMFTLSRLNAGEGPRPARLRSLPTPPGEAHPEPGRGLPALPGVLRRAGPGLRSVARSSVATVIPIR